MAVTGSQPRVSELDRVVQVDLTHGDALGEMHRVAGLEEDVEPPALDLRRLVLVPERGFGRLGHARGIRGRDESSFSVGQAVGVHACWRASSTIRSSSRCDASFIACWSSAAIRPSARRRKDSAVRSSSSRRRSAASSRIARIRFSNSSAPASLRASISRAIARSRCSTCRRSSSANASSIRVRASLSARSICSFTACSCWRRRSLSSSIVLRRSSACAESSSNARVECVARARLELLAQAHRRRALLVDRGVELVRLGGDLRLDVGDALAHAAARASRRRPASAF